MTTACAATRPPSPSRASSPTWSGARRRPTAPGCARSSAATRTPAPARSATASGSSPRRWRSRSPASTSARSPISRSPRPARWFGALDRKLTAKQREIAQRILKEINERLGFLKNVGLEYLTLSRASGTLSGGESQRIRLASQIGSGLTGVLYVLDEPSIGLHQRDNDRLLATLKRLRDLGNTVLVVEHDEEAIRAADYLIDMGPGAGRPWRPGGRRRHAGQVMQNPDSLTGQYLTGAPDPHPAAAPQRGQRAQAQHRRRARQQPEERHASIFRSAPSPASPASRAAANRP